MSVDRVDLLTISFKFANISQLMEKNPEVEQDTILLDISFLQSLRQ